MQFSVFLGPMALFVLFSSLICILFDANIDEVCRVTERQACSVLEFLSGTIETNAIFVRCSQYRIPTATETVYQLHATTLYHTDS